VIKAAADVPAILSAAEAPLSPAEALVKLFLDNADRGRNAENDVFVEQLLRRMRAIQQLATAARTS
jgi:hypothetical protein